MQQLELKIGVVLNPGFIQVVNFFITHSQSGGIHQKIGLLFGCNPDAQLGWLCCFFVDELKFFGIIEHTNQVVKPVTYQVGHILRILLGFKAVAYNVLVFAKFAGCVQALNNFEVKCRRGFQVDPIIEHLIEDKTKMGTLGTIAIIILCLVIIFFEGTGKQFPGRFNLRTYFREISKL